MLIWLLGYGRKSGMTRHLKLLIVGGYGVFGGRIVAPLEDDPRLTMLVAGRSRERASAFCEARGATKAAARAAGLRSQRRPRRADRDRSRRDHATAGYASRKVRTWLTNNSWC
jgi:hypothetical protein